MGLCAFLAPDRIPLSLFTDDVLSEIDRSAAVAVLQEVSLVTQDPLDDGSRGLGMHRLVQATMRGRLKEMGEHENAAALATELVADTFPFDSDDVREWPACARLMPHALAIFEHAPEMGQAAVKTTRLLTSAGLNYYARAAWRNAEPLYLRALTIDEKNQGADHSDVARDLNNLALLLHDTDRLAEAEPLYRRSLAIDERCLGADHPKVATSHNNLALLLQATNRLDEAERHFRRALAIDEKSLGPDDPEVATDLNNLAELLRITNRLDEAAPLVHRALAIDTSRFGADHPYVARELANLAQLLRARGSLAEAESVMRRALAITETGLGRNHPDVALRLYDLAHLLQATNRRAEAEPLMLRVVELLERSEQNTGHRHPRYEDAIRNLAALEAELRVGGAAPEGSAMGSDPQGLTPTPAAPQAPARKRGFMGGLFPRRA
jgi:tetratricopeptide (TPR) repeat protein